MRTKKAEWVEWVEIPVRVYAICYPEERVEKHYPGHPAYAEIDEIKIENENGDRMIDLDQLKNQIIAENEEDFQVEAWEHTED